MEENILEGEPGRTFAKLVAGDFEHRVDQFFGDVALNKADKIDLFNQVGEVLDQLIKDFYVNPDDEIG